MHHSPLIEKGTLSNLWTLKTHIQMVIEMFEFQKNSQKLTTKIFKIK